MGDVVSGVTSLDHIEVEFHGDSRPRKLFFGIAEIKALQRRAGQPLTVVMGQLGLMNVEVTEHCLYVGLQRDDAKLKPDVVTKLLQAHLAGGGDLDQVNDLITEAMKAGGVLKRDKRSPDQLRQQIARLEAELVLVEAAEEATSEPDPTPTS